MFHSLRKSLALLLALALLGGCAAQQAQPELLERAQEQTQQSLAEVRSGTLLRRTPGFVNCEVQYAVDTEVSLAGFDGWQIAETYAATGDRVTAGQELALLQLPEDPAHHTGLQNAVRAAQLAYEAQRAQGAAEVERLRAAWQGAAADSAEKRQYELELARAQYALSLVSDAALTQAQSELAAYESNVQGRTVCATADGTFASMLRPGETVAAQTALCRIYSPDQLLLVAENVNDAAFRCGARVTIYLAGKTVGEGTVLSAPDVYGATTGQMIVRPDDAVQLQNAASSQSAAVSATRMYLEQVLLLPAAALRNEGGKYYVYLYADGTLHKRYVTVGTEGENEEGETCVQIVDGLRAGDAVTLG